ncbi:MAG: hypothetical protein J6B77_05480, partial [Clostridia bacterium]|nr:hypothetical protein [Clostridia bacterium]
PVRMKWGRIVEDPNGTEDVPKGSEEHASAPEPAEPAKDVPRVDRRFEALRAQLEASAEPSDAPPSATPQEGAEAPPIRPDTRKPQPRREVSGEAPPVTVRRAEPSPQAIRAARAREAERARLAEEAARAKAWENEQMRAELEQAELRRALKKKRRRERFSEGVVGFFGGIAALFGALFRLIRSSWKAILVILITLVLAVLLTVVLGNFLKTRVDPGTGSGTSEESTSETEELPTLPSRNTPRINAGMVSLKDATVRSLKAEARRFVSAGITAVSLLMREENGKLMFSARADQAFPNQSESESLLSAEEILTPFLEEGLYVSCLFPIRYDADGNDYTRSVLFAYECALLSEIAEAGANEVIVLCASNMLIPRDDEVEELVSVDAAIAELSDMAHFVRNRVSDTAVGIALTPEFLSAKEHDRDLGRLATAFDLVLLDLSGDGNDAEAVAEHIAEYLYFVLRYEMRVLLPGGTAEAAIRSEIRDWQEATPAPRAEESTEAGTNE